MLTKILYEVAIECDGERFHSGEEKIRQDMERQTILERLGWRFIRIRGSEYYRDKEETMDDVFTRIHVLGIQPSAIKHQGADPTPLLDSIKQKAAQLIERWHCENKKLKLRRCKTPVKPCKIHISSQNKIA